MGRDIEEETPLARVGQVVFKCMAEPDLLIEIRIIEVEIALQALESFEKVYDRRPFGLLLGRPPEPFDNKKCGIVQKNTPSVCL